jgi:hypothetical protein
MPADKESWKSAESERVIILPALFGILPICAGPVISGMTA